MPRTFTLSACYFVLSSFYANGQHVGIGTNTPLARLHVADSAVLFTGSGVMTNDYNIPVSGIGARMMWLPAKAAFRVGFVNGAHWDKDKIGVSSFAAGMNTVGSGDYSAALGYVAKATNFEAVAVGSHTESTGLYSTALGYASTASGVGSIGMGYHAEAKGTHSIAIGPQSVTHGVGSITLGSNLVSNAHGQITLGMYNKDFPNAIGYLWDENDPLVVIGHGNSPASAKNAFTLLKNGYIGIGSDQPAQKLHVANGAVLVQKNSTNGNGQLILDESEFADGSRITFRNTGVANRYWDMYAYTHPSTNSEAKVNFNYNAVGTNFTLYGNGNAWLRGTLTQNSDARLKKDIQPITGTLNQLTYINGYTYHWKDSAADHKLQAGILAQEIETIWPHLVHQHPDGSKAVNYLGLIPYLLQAIKEQQQTISQLAARL